MTHAERVLDTLRTAGKPLTVAQIEKKTKIKSGLPSVLTKMTAGKQIIRVERGTYSAEAPAAAPTAKPASLKLRGEIRSAVSLEASGENLIVSVNGSRRKIALAKVVELAARDGQPI